MKIAVFHNFLDNIGGAEIVGLTLARELNADVYTTNIDKEKIIKMGFEDVLPRIYSIGKVPINAPFKQQLALLRFRFLNLNKQPSEPNKYDYYIIDGDWAMAGAVNNKPNLWYVHSPIREIWDLYKYTRQNTVPWFLKWFFDVWVLYNRHLNKKYVNYVDKLVCNSENTKNRIKKYLNKDAVVINPPIETSKFHFKKNGDYWLSVNRLITHKRIDLQLKAFAKLPEEKLIIVGSYEQSRHFKQYAKYCGEIKPKNVEIKNWVPQDELIDLYANCKGFITTSQDEDFGMNVVEAMASGKPVIAPNEGGYKETIINNKTGILIDNIDENKLIDAIKLIGQNSENYKNACINQAQNFDTKIFIDKLREIIII
jgi:glycosyltransferase involved in cell wall biosynthesis